MYEFGFEFLSSNVDESGSYLNIKPIC